MNLKKKKLGLSRRLGNAGSRTVHGKGDGSGVNSANVHYDGLDEGPGAQMEERTRKKERKIFHSLSSTVECVLKWLG